MAHKFNVKFPKRYLSCQGPNVLGTQLTSKCFSFDLCSAGSGAITEPVDVVPKESVKHQWLYGPATDLASRRVIYPCALFKCSFPCPCLRCRKIHPKCRVNSSSLSCSCQECYEFFHDHEMYHIIPHLGCRACHQLTSVLPNFNYFFFNMRKEEPCFESGWVRYGRQDVHYGLDLEKVPPGILCVGCEGTLSGLEDLKQHLLNKHQVICLFRHRYKNSRRDKTEKLQCFQCLTSFATSKELNRHIEAKHFETTFDCDICGSIFSREDRYLRHMRSRHQDKRFGNYVYKCSCKECGEKFYTSDALGRHMKTHRVALVKKLECQKCNKVFTIKGNYKRHVESNMKDGVFKYRFDQCKISFCTNTMLIKHVQDEHNGGITSFKCQRCALNYDSESELKTHNEMIHALESFRCDHCDSRFKKKSSFRQHIREHLRYPKMFTCEECDHKFSSGEALRKHSEVHRVTEGEKFECAKCWKVFSLLKNYKRHIENSLEDGVARYGCDQCKKSFCSKTFLTDHMESDHKAGAGKHACHRCSINYESKSQLNVHNESVHQPEEFQCDGCHKSFARMDNLTRHQVNHKISDYMKHDFKCSLCDFTFAWKTNYQRHMKGIYKEDGSIKNKCEMCGQDFCTSKLLKAHTFSHHYEYFG